MLLKVPIYCFLLFIFLSCKKNHSETTLIPDQDTLGAGWSKVSIGIEEVIVDIHFSGNVGYGISATKILKSIDAGNSWHIVFENSQHAYNISSGSANNIITLGRSKVIYFSNNGGSTFDSVFVEDNQLNEIFFASEDIAFAIGSHFWKTTDAGKSWQKLYSFPEENALRIYRTVHFINEFKGWAIASTKQAKVGLFKTEDGGTNWQIIDSGYSKYGFNSIFLVDENYGYTSNTTQTIKTIDGGNTWAKIRDNTASFADTHFLSKDIGYISNNKKIYKTVDGGLSFTTEVALGMNNNDASIIEIYFTDINHGWACGYKGHILKYQK